MAEGKFYTMQIMGTTVSLKLKTEHPLAVNDFFYTIKRLEDYLTVNRPNSEVMKINYFAGKRPVAVSSIVYRLIDIAKKTNQLGNGTFNLAIGPLVKLWKIGFLGQNIPSQKFINEKLALTNPHFIELDPKNQTVFLQKENMELDLGAIAKGYIADICKEVLAKHSIKEGIIDLGGNIMAIGNSPFSLEGYWKIGLQKPFSDKTHLLGFIYIKDKSVVTSGIYERCFYHHGKLYHHVFDPNTGYPLDNELESVTIISDKSIEGDIYSTVIYGLGLNKGLEYLRQQENISAIFVTKEKKIILSSNNIQFILLDDSYQLINQIH